MVKRGDAREGRSRRHGLRIRVKDMLDLLAAGADCTEVLGTIRCWWKATSPQRSNTRGRSWGPGVEEVHLYLTVEMCR
jgi:hypothetical protein